MVCSKVQDVFFVHTHARVRVWRVCCCWCSPVAQVIDAHGDDVCDSGRLESKVARSSNVRPRLVHRLVMASSEVGCGPSVSAVGRHVHTHNTPPTTRVRKSLGVNGLSRLICA